MKVEENCLVNGNICSCLAWYLNSYLFPFVVVQAEIYESIKKCLIDDRPRDFADCVSWARIQFQENYHNTIKQLLYNFPPDQVCFYRLH